MLQIKSNAHKTEYWDSYGLPGKFQECPRDQKDMALSTYMMVLDKVPDREPHS